MPSTGTPISSTARIRRRRIDVIHRARPTRKNDPLRPQRLHPLERNRARQNHGEHVELPYPPRNQLSVLRAKIQNDNGRSVHGAFQSNAAAQSVNRRPVLSEPFLIRSLRALRQANQTGASHKDHHRHDPCAYARAPGSPHTPAHQPTPQFRSRTRQTKT